MATGDLIGVPVVFPILSMFEGSKWSLLGMADTALEEEVEGWGRKEQEPSLDGLGVAGIPRHAELADGWKDTDVIVAGVAERVLVDTEAAAPILASWASLAF